MDIQSLIGILGLGLILGGMASQIQKELEQKKQKVRVPIKNDPPRKR